MLKSINDVQFMSKHELGEGAYARVFHVKHKKTQKEFALKHVI